MSQTLDPSSHRTFSAQAYMHYLTGQAQNPFIFIERSLHVNIAPDCLCPAPRVGQCSAEHTNPCWPPDAKNSLAPKRSTK